MPFSQRNAHGARPLLVNRVTTGDDFFFLLKIFAQLLCIAGDTYCPIAQGTLIIYYCPGRVAGCPKFKSAVCFIVLLCHPAHKLT